MGLIQDIKKEWTWTSIKQSWPDFLSTVIDLLSIGPAVFLADEFREKGFLVWAGVWAATYITSELLLRFIARMIIRVKK